MQLFDFYTILLSAILLCSIYSLMAIGLSLIYTTMRIFNFAHGTLMMICAYIVWTLIDNRGLGMSMWPGVFIGVVVLFGVGFLVEKIIVNPFLNRRNGDMIVLIATMMAASFLEQSSMLIWGPQLKRLPELVKVHDLSFLGSNLSGVQLLILIIGPVFLLGLGLFLKYTRIGLAIRGVAQNRRFAQLAGIIPSRINAITFGLGSSMAGIAGVLMASKSLMTIQMGGEPLIKAFIVLILGGVGSMGATIIGAFIIGLLESLSVYFVGLYWTPAILFLVMIIVLTFKPTGIFGDK